jgi:hypothetical protein
MVALHTDGAEVLALWKNEGVTNRPKRPRDAARLAKQIVDIESGEVQDREPKRGLHA